MVRVEEADIEMKDAQRSHMVYPTQLQHPPKQNLNDRW